MKTKCFKKNDSPYHVIKVTEAKSLCSIVEGRANGVSRITTDALEAYYTECSEDYYERHKIVKEK